MRFRRLLNNVDRKSEWTKNDGEEPSDTRSEDGNLIVKCSLHDVNNLNAHHCAQFACGPSVRTAIVSIIRRIIGKEACTNSTETTKSTWIPDKIFSSNGTVSQQIVTNSGKNQIFWTHTLNLLNFAIASHWFHILPRHSTKFECTRTFTFVHWITWSWVDVDLVHEEDPLSIVCKFQISSEYSNINYCMILKKLWISSTSRFVK